MTVERASDDEQCPHGLSFALLSKHMAQCRVFGGVSNLNNRKDEGGGGRKRAQSEDTRLNFTDPVCLKIHWKGTQSKASS